MLFNKDPYEILTEFFVRFGRTYNGYEIHGLDHIPKDGPALLVFYHALAPLDCYYFNFEMYRRLGRKGFGLGDRFLFKTPGIKQLVELSGGVPGTRENAIRLLRQGEIVGVSPGGTREAVSGSNMDYRLKWKGRKGFAEVIKELPHVPVIPGFTENVEQLYRAPFAGNKLFQKFYEKTRLPLTPIVGLGAMPFPVKLRTWVGEPIYIKPEESAESLRDRTKESLTSLIRRHQRGDVSISKAILENLAEKLGL